MGVTGIEPARATVKPRVLSAAGEAIPLEDEIRELLDEGARGVVALLGGAGGGKTTALRHLAAVLPSDAPVVLLDGPTAGEVRAAAPDRLTIATATGERQAGPAGARTFAPVAGSERLVAVYWLAPWGRDDLIEYLLAAHPSCCAAVLARLGPADRALLGGSPELWRLVLDRLAADETIPDARSALHRHLEAQLSDTDLLERARSLCLNAQLAPAMDLPAALAQLTRPGGEWEVARVVRHPAARLLLAAERIAADLHGEAACDYLARRLPRELVRAAAMLIAGDGRAAEHLDALLAGPPWSHAMAASLLHALSTGFVLRGPGPAHLAGAYLDGAVWPGAPLAHADLTGADLTGADLREADLSSAVAHEAILREAKLHAATLPHLGATGADLFRADLTGVQAGAARFDEANLEGADLTGAWLRGGSFTGARLVGAMFQKADLNGALFAGARLAGAVFIGADLTWAKLEGLRLREAEWSGANFTEAVLRGCDLEGMVLPAAQFTRANLDGALLTTSTMPGAHFDRACLRNAGLAEVEWEGVSLLGADLRGASFHLGSTRSGLVGSPIAGEGSRTGFYTDEYEEQTYKAPEEIRKANLCGADLRGALIDDVDFYLVDLRGARYDASQEEVFRRCGAILESRK